MATTEVFQDWESPHEITSVTRKTTRKTTTKTTRRYDPNTTTDDIWGDENQNDKNKKNEVRHCFIYLASVNFCKEL